MWISWGPTVCQVLYLSFYLIPTVTQWYISYPQFTCGNIEIQRVWLIHPDHTATAYCPLTWVYEGYLANMQPDAEPTSFVFKLCWAVRNNSWIMHSKFLKNSTCYCKQEPKLFPTKGKFQGLYMYLTNQMHHRTRNSKNHSGINEWHKQRLLKGIPKTSRRLIVYES